MRTSNGRRRATSPRHEADLVDVDAARSCEQEATLIFESAPIGMALVSTDSRFLRVNPALCALVGFEADELLATTLRAISHPEDLDIDTEHVLSCLDGTIDRYALEKRYIHRDGHAVWVQLNVATARTGTGAPIQFVAQILDISARRAAEAELAAAKARFAALVEHGSDLICLADEGGRLLYASPAHQRLLGVDPASQVGKQLQDLIHPDDLEHVTALVTPILGHPGASATTEFRFAHADGSWRWMETTITNRLSDPAVRGFVGNSRDVTDRVVAAERLAFQALHDPLTGLPNRASLDTHLDQVAADAEQRDEVVAGLYVDIDHFKRVNDTYGHAVGDELLVQAAARLRRAVRTGDRVLRLGGDEFAVLAVVRSPAAATDLGTRICKAFASPFRLGIHTVPVTVSVGIASRCDLADGLGILEAADRALYQAKTAGRARWTAFAPSETPPSTRRSCTSAA